MWIEWDCRCFLCLIRTRHGRMFSCALPVIFTSCSFSMTGWGFRLFVSFLLLFLFLPSPFVCACVWVWSFALNVVSPFSKMKLISIEVTALYCFNICPKCWFARASVLSRSNVIAKSKLIFFLLRLFFDSFFFVRSSLACSSSSLVLLCAAWRKWLWLNRNAGWKEHTKKMNEKKKVCVMSKVTLSIEHFRYFSEIFLSLSFPSPFIDILFYSFLSSSFFPVLCQRPTSFCVMSFLLMARTLSAYQSNEWFSNTTISQFRRRLPNFSWLFSRCWHTNTRMCFAQPDKQTHARGKWTQRSDKMCHSRKFAVQQALTVFRRINYIIDREEKSKTNASSIFHSTAFYLFRLRTLCVSLNFREW